MRKIKLSQHGVVFAELMAARALADTGIPECADADIEAACYASALRGEQESTTPHGWTSFRAFCHGGQGQVLVTLAAAQRVSAA